MALKLSRRNLLGLAAAFVVAPAIVRSESLMPIKVFNRYGPNGLLTPQMIADEMAKQMVLCGAIFDGSAIGGQSNIDQFRDNANETLSLEQYSSRLLRPMARIMINHVRQIGSAPEIPASGVRAAIGRYGDVSVRYMSMYDIGCDRYINRFGVRNA